jgi:hypothetical protein
MTISGSSNLNADGLASNLLTSLITGASFDAPVVDLADASLQAPSTVENPLYTAVSPVEEIDVTQRVVGGTGMFDGLMKALDAHLNEQYDKSRLTGSEYASAYVQLTQAALANAVQFVLQKDAAYYGAILAQKQAQAAEVAVATSRAQLEAAKAQVAVSLNQVEQQKVDYALTKMKLTTEDAAYAGAVAQKDQLLYQTANILPAELASINKQIDVMTSEISVKAAQEAQVLYQNANILPAQKQELDKNIAIKAYQLSDQLPAEVANVTADTTGKSYTNTNILPAQLLSINEQTEAHRAKTLDTRSDGLTAIAGSIGKQKELHQQQIDSYQRDAESKVAKMLLDTWTVQKSMDEGLAPPTSLTDSNIDTVMTKIRTNLSLT